MALKTPDRKTGESRDWDSPDFEIPPFLRFPANGTREATEMMISRIDAKITQLATLGLHPHPTMLGYRRELVEQLDRDGPYRLRMSSGFF